MSADFRQFAPCASVDPEAMFPNPKNQAGVVLAKRICDPCEFRSQCLDLALAPDTRSEFGVFGGLSEHERRALARRRGRRTRHSMAA
ncbi:WhiB family transcriptional regulator [Streptomyces sp. NPDC001691]|uniref:WhiB family transcriptional regulator n=1 Tax=Streptomyces sp. NPDC001691 TaxID=3364600 RepID=UPI00368EF81B